jgi:hypothetical protein
MCGTLCPFYKGWTRVPKILPELCGLEPEAGPGRGGAAGPVIATFDAGAPAALLPLCRLCGLFRLFHFHII